MPLEVQSQVVGPGEAPVALGALEWRDAGVLPVVTGQLVWAGKPLGAPLPRAPERLLTRVGAGVGLRQACFLRTSTGSPFQINLGENKIMSWRRIKVMLLFNCR